MACDFEAATAGKALVSKSYISRLENELAALRTKSLGHIPTFGTPSEGHMGDVADESSEQSASPAPNAGHEHITVRLDDAGTTSEPEETPDHDAERAVVDAGQGNPLAISSGDSPSFVFDDTGRPCENALSLKTGVPSSRPKIFSVFRPTGRSGVESCPWPTSASMDKRYPPRAFCLMLQRTAWAGMVEDLTPCLIHPLHLLLTMRCS